MGGTLVRPPVEKLEEKGRKVGDGLVEANHILYVEKCVIFSVQFSNAK